MTLTYCDVCGVQIDTDALPKPTHHSLKLSHYSPMTSWEASDVWWDHVCLGCTVSVKAILAEFADSRHSQRSARA